MESDLVFALGYIACHLGIFLVGPRRLQSFQRERNVFLFHAISFVLLSSVLLGRLATGAPGCSLAGVVAGVSLHAIYSLSFLELWALSKTGFSLRLLSEVARTGPKTASEILGLYLRVSGNKKRDRIRSLLALRLVGEKGGRVVLTGPGRRVAAVLATISRTSGTREGG